MISKINYIKSIGSFYDFNPITKIDLDRLNLFYGDNGSGKSTFARMIRSLVNQDSNLILNKKTINSSNNPECSLLLKNNNTFYFNFKDEKWNVQTNSNYNLNDIIVFDDEFIEKNIFTSSFDPDIDHARNQYKLIFGETAIKINSNKEILKNRKKVLELARTKLEQQLVTSYSVTPEEFDKLTFPQLNELREESKNLDKRINDTRNNNSSLPAEFKLFSSPVFILDGLISETYNLLQSNIDSEAHKNAKLQVNEFKQRYFNNKTNADSFLKYGMDCVEDNSCPFCHNELAEDLFDVYKNYFDKSYEDFVSNLKQVLEKIHKIPESYKNSLSQIEIHNVQSFHSWKNSVPSLNYQEEKNILNLIDVYNTHVQKLIDIIRGKLDDTSKTDFEMVQISTYRDKIIDLIAILNDQIVKNNQQINDYKASLQTVDVKQLIETLKKVKIKIQIVENKEVVDQLILDIKAKREELEELNKQIKGLDVESELECEKITTEFIKKINHYLKGENFRIDKIQPINHSKYNEMHCEIVLIFKEIPLKIYGSQQLIKFNDVLSTGERRNLAFAFFMASLEINTKSLENKTLVFDDPICSLDYNRKAITVQRIIELTEKVAQILILTHDKIFFTHLFENSLQQTPQYFRIKKMNTGSQILVQDKGELNDLIGKDHHVRHDRLTKFCDGGGSVAAGNALNELRSLFEDLLEYKFPKSSKEIKSKNQTLFTYNSFNNYFVKNGEISRGVFNELNDQKVLFYANEGSHVKTTNSDLSDQEIRNYVIAGLELFKKI